MTDTELSLRALRHEDAPVIKPWLRTYLTEHLTWWQEAYGRTPEGSLDELVEKNWHNLIEANIGGQCVKVIEEPLSGIVFAEKRQEHYMGFDIGILSWIYVDPAARGQGVSRRLMKAAHEWMDEQGVQGRQVFVTAANQAAVKLYQRYGYQVADYRMLATAGDNLLEFDSNDELD